MFKGLWTKFKNFVGRKTGAMKNLTTITDHPDIKLSPDEVNRVIRNKDFFRNVFQDVEFIDNNGQRCTRAYNSVPLPKIVARKLAKLVFNEGVAINVEVSQDNGERNVAASAEAQDFIDAVLDDNRFKQVFSEELEGGYAVSGLAIVPNFDAITQRLTFSYCSADNFVPLDGNTSTVSEAAIINHYRSMEKGVLVYYTLFAFHRRYGVRGGMDELGAPTWGYEIVHELYRSEDPERVGQEVELTTLDETAGLPELVQFAGLDRPLFVYIKLAGKNNVNYGSPLGLGVIDNAYRQLHNFNDIYDKYMDEIDTATRQLVASNEFFDVAIDPVSGMPRQIFNPGTHIYQKLNTEEPIIQDFSPTIRATEYINSLNFILRVIEQDTGFSAGTFSFDGQSVKTATEVISENTDTYQTRSDNVQIVSQALSDLVYNCFYLGSFYDLYQGDYDAPSVDVDFDDGVFTSKTEKLQFAGTARTFGLLSVQTAMKKAFGWDDRQAAAEFEKMAEEQPVSTERVQQLSEEEIFGPLEV